MKSIAFEIILTKPTPGVVFGLQKGSGSKFETVQKQKASTQDLSFRFSIPLKDARPVDDHPKFTGSYVQGPSNSKFVYIDIGTYAGQTDSVWSRRLKIPLTGISWSDIDQLMESSILRTRVPGTDKHGAPNCATVKPFDGWHVYHL